MCVCVYFYITYFIWQQATQRQTSTWMRLAPGALAYGRHGKVGLQCVPHVASTHTHTHMHTMQRQQAAYKRHPGEVGSGAAEGLKLWMKLELQLQQLANAARTHSHTHRSTCTHEYHQTHTHTGKEHFWCGSACCSCTQWKCNDKPQLTMPHKRKPITQEISRTSTNASLSNRTAIEPSWLSTKKRSQGKRKKESHQLERSNWKAKQ